MVQSRFMTVLEQNTPRVQADPGIGILPHERVDSTVLGTSHSEVRNAVCIDPHRGQ